MKDIEKILSSLKPVEAPPELRRKVIARLETSSSNQPNNFLEWFLQDWNGWTARVWFSIPCLIVFFLMFAMIQGEHLIPSSGDQPTLSAMSLQEMMVERQRMLAILNADVEEQILSPPAQPGKDPRPGACLNDRKKCMA